ncbi:HvfX family Cu-binding RiPP maturation protein [Elizabethkingia anophelis]|uniref:DoxX family protein n=1 Tax=Elizabethkingia anophelis TaxID=1117645 RepID=A0AAU8VKP6_9FLAO|nr:DoxX family protein [Elizabethkingia anophelis]AQX03586.1 DoxX family protein [Elizabethkingia anophelis]OPB61689.1 DoxX family protein [Elizabethkingia anophelis]
MRKLQNIINQSYKIKDSVLLVLRLVLMYGFFNPAMIKIKDINSIAGWFESLGIPLPNLNVYLTTGTEVLGIILLALGLFTRWISIPLIVIMIVAIITVHLENGFNAGDNGFEIPLYYILMLLILFTFGAGKYSLDQFLKLNRNDK